MTDDDHCTSRRFRSGVQPSWRVAIITGAGKGIGRAIALVFAAAGASIVVATRTAASGQATVDEITAKGGSASLIVCDVGKRAAAALLVDAALSRFGRIDIVLHNAAVYPMCPIAELSEDMLDETLAVNLKAAFWLTAAALPHLRKSPAPRILVTSSVTGPRVALPGLSPLCGFQVRAQWLHPRRRDGVCARRHHRKRRRTRPDPHRCDQRAGRCRRCRRHGPGPFRCAVSGAAEEIAFAMQYLASNAGAFVTGQTIIVDGGALLPENLSALE